MVIPHLKKSTLNVHGYGDFRISGQFPIPEQHERTKKTGIINLTIMWTSQDT